MDWVSVIDRLPEDGQAVLVRYNHDNWEASHKLADGKVRRKWRWQAAIFRKGKTAEEVRATRSCSGYDQDGNNLVPYAWDQFGPGKLFGQDVSHWCAITDPLDDEGDAS